MNALDSLKMNIICCLAALLWFVPFAVFGGSINLEISEINDNGEVKITVFANTEKDRPFNAAGASILFDDRDFVISQINTNDSIFDLWVIEPKIMSEGIIEFAGGTTAKGGFIFKGELFSFYAQLKSEAPLAFTFTDPQLLASDGFGTDILDETNAPLLTQDESIPYEYDTDQDGSVSILELSIGMQTET